MNKTKNNQNGKEHPLKRFVYNKYFEFIILILVLLSVAMLISEKLIDYPPEILKIINKADFIILIIFSFEFIIKFIFNKFKISI